MKIRDINPLIILTLVVSVSITMGQGTFQNLDFEGANVVQIPGQPNEVTVANALPGWTVDYGNAQQTQIYYNQASTGGTEVDLIANGYPTGGGALDGNFSVLLQGGLNLFSQPANAIITQTGQIPNGTQSISFEAGISEPEVFIGSDQLTLFPINAGNGYTIYGANISEWAGQTEQLTFSEAPPLMSEIDDISFSPNQITVTPEPDTLTLMSVGGLLFGLYRRIQFTRK